MSSVIISGDTSGSITLSAPAVAGSNTLTLPASTGTVVTTGSPQSGSVIQVVNAITSTQTSTTGSTFIDTGLTATITPKFATSKILVIVDHSDNYKAGGNTFIQMQLLRGATVLTYLSGLGAWTNTTAINDCGSISTNYLDSPATTSAVTYKTQFNSSNGATAVYVQLVNNFQTSSTITLMEIAA